MRKAVRVLGGGRVVDFSTKAGIDFHTYAMEVARDTGRVIFGQLWMPDPDIGEVLHAYYAPIIVDMVNNRNPLAALLGGE